MQGKTCFLEFTGRIELHNVFLRNERINPAFFLVQRLWHHTGWNQRMVCSDLSIVECLTHQGQICTFRTCQAQFLQYWQDTDRIAFL